MKLFCTIVNEVDKVDQLLERFLEVNIPGSTIVSASGMASSLIRSNRIEDVPMFSALRNYFNNDRVEHALVLTVLSDDKVSLASNIVEEVLGDLSKPNTGICFALSLDFVKGVSHE